MSTLEQGQEDQYQMIFDELRRLELTAHDVGKYILEKVIDDKKFLQLKGNIILENDTLKIDHNDFKTFLLKMEYIALLLTKQNYDLE